MTEGFRPIGHTPPDLFFGKVKFYGRMLLDLQVVTIYRDIRKVILSIGNKVIVLWCRNLMPADNWKRFLVPVWVALTSILPGGDLRCAFFTDISSGKQRRPIGVYNRS